MIIWTFFQTSHDISRCKKYNGANAHRFKSLGCVNSYDLDAHVKAHKMPNIDSEYGTGMWDAPDGYMDNKPGNIFTAGDESTCSKIFNKGWWYSEDCIA